MLDFFQTYAKIVELMCDAAIAQMVERVIGNDEVGSSNLPSSSIVAADCILSAAIFYALHEKITAHAFRRSSSQNRNR